MSWKPVTQPAVDALPVLSTKKASLQVLVEKEKQGGPVVGKHFKLFYLVKPICFSRT